MSDTGNKIADAIENEIGGIFRGDWLWEHGIDPTDFERFLDAGRAEFDDDADEDMDEGTEASCQSGLRPGTMVVMMGGGYYVAPEFQGQVWVVDSEPWRLGDGTEVVRLKGYEYGCYATDGLVPIIFPDRDA